MFACAQTNLIADRGMHQLRGEGDVADLSLHRDPGDHFAACFGSQGNRFPRNTRDVSGFGWLVPNETDVEKCDANQQRPTSPKARIARPVSFVHR